MCRLDISVARWTDRAIAAVVLSAIAGGMPTLLNRVGVAHPERYERAWRMHCGAYGTTSEPLGIGRRCIRLDITGDPAHNQLLSTRPYMSYVTALEPQLILVKATRDLVLFGIFGLGLVSLRKQRRYPLEKDNAGPLVPMIALLFTLAVVGLLQGSVVETVAGIRSLFFVPLGLICVGLVAQDTFDSMSVGIAVLLLVQIAAAAVEFLYGLPIHGILTAWSFPRRMAGTFVQPNSLGVFATLGFAFVLSFSARPGLKVLTGVAAGCLAFFSGSGTAVVCLLVLLGYVVVGGMGSQGSMDDGSSPQAPLSGVRARTGLLAMTVWSACVAATLWKLPSLVGRFDVYDSVAGRVDSLVLLLSVPLRNMILGHGLGHGTNSLASFRTLDLLNSWAGLPLPFESDSLLLSLLVQSGFVGLGVAAFVFLRCFFLDPRARPFYLAAGVAALTLNIGELFPANLLLSLALAHSLVVRSGSDGAQGLSS